MTDHTAKSAFDELAELRARVERLEQVQQPATGDQTWTHYVIHRDGGSYMQSGKLSRSAEQAQQQSESGDDETLHTVALRMVDTLTNLGLLPEITDTIRKAIREPMAQSQPIPRYNLRFRGVDLVPPIDCPDSMMWIAERAYQMGKEQPNCPHIRNNGDGSSYCTLAEGNSTSLTSSAPAPSTPAGQGELVRSVAGAIHPDQFGWEPEARSMIRVVADWLERHGLHAAADLLRREVGR
jgi:hypothetical protein